MNATANQTNQAETAQASAIIYKTTSRKAIDGATQYTDHDGTIYNVKDYFSPYPAPSGWHYGLLFTNAAPLVQLLSQDSAKGVIGPLGRHNSTRQGAISGTPIILDDETVLLPLYVHPYERRQAVRDHIATLTHLLLALAAPNVKLFYANASNFLLVGSIGEVAAPYYDGHVWDVDHKGYTELSQAMRYIQKLGIPAIKRESWEIEHEYYAVKAARAYRGA